MITDADREAIAAAVEALDVGSWTPLTDAEADLVRRALTPVDVEPARRAA